MEREIYKKEIKLMSVIRILNKSITDILGKDLNRLGISITDYQLMFILDKTGPIPMQELGKHLNITSGSITYAADRLIRTGLLEKIQDESDKRKFLIELTGKGREKLESVNREHLPYLGKIFSTYSRDELDVLIEAVTKLGKSIEENKAK